MNKVIELLLCGMFMGSYAARQCTNADCIYFRCTYSGCGRPCRTGAFYGAQVQSTRLFNENYYAFLAALDDVARRDIRWVVLPGDLTDDGQFFNQQKIKELLNSYAAAKGMRFFVTTGNHDPALPLGL